MSGASEKVHFQNLSSFDEDLEVKYKVPKFEALSKKYKKFEKKEAKVVEKQKTTAESMLENEEK